MLEIIRHMMLMTLVKWAKQIFIKGIVKTREQTETIDDIQNEIISVEDEDN
jgi:hypothetical protein